MKKQTLPLLVLMTAAFACFTLGFFLGRNSPRGQVTVALPPAMRTEPVPAEPPAPLPEPPEVQFPLDLNRANLDELMALPGIGYVLARRILAYREINGPFSRVEELMNIEGIGEKRVEDLLEKITIGG